MKYQGWTLFLFFTLLWACQPEGGSSGSKTTLPDSNGGILDILVIAPESLWNGPAGDEFKKHFTGMQYGLPQPMPRFTVRQIQEKDYGDLLKRSRYQVIFVQGAEQIKYREQQHAKNQLIIYLSAPDAESLKALIREHQGEMQIRIKAKERRRLIKRLKPVLRKEISPVYQRHHVHLALPRDFELEVEEESTLVYWKKTQRADQGIIVHFRPFPEDQSIMGQDIVPIRDSLTKKHILGERPGSYMKTETLVKPQITSLEMQGNFALEARGLWVTENDIMGGPFVSYTIYDEKNHQVIYLDAFMFAPDQKKRNTLFEMEAILRSVEIL